MVDKTLVYKDYLDLIKDSSYTQLYEYYSNETTMGILGVDRQENPHSSFIKWILDINGKHGYGSVPMRKFLETVCLFKEKVYHDRDSNEVKVHGLWNSPDNLLNSKNSQLLEEIKYGRYEISKQSIVTEKVLKNQRRADIFAILKITMQGGGENNPIFLMLMIENKVHSAEHDQQTEAYFDSLCDFNYLNDLIEINCEGWIEKENFENIKIYKLFVYLNAYSTSEIKDAFEDRIKEPDKTSGPFAASDEFITLNYQYLLDGVIEPLQDIVGNEFSRLRITDYIRCLGQAKISSLNENNDNKKNDNKKNANGKSDEYMIMAVSKTEKQLAVDLWKKYSGTIYKIVESYLYSSDEFILNVNDRDFWSSIANLYRLIDSEELRLDNEDSGDESRTKKLKDIVKNANSTANNPRQKHKYTYNGKNYISYKWPSIGYLFRNIISEYINNASKDGERQREILERLRKELQSWKSSWNNETILFDDEVEKIQNGTYEFGKNKTKSIAEFANSFFSYLRPNRGKLVDPLIYDKNHEEKLDDKYEIKLKNGDKAYISRFWGVDAVEELVKDVLPNRMGDACDSSFISLVKRKS